MSQPDDVICTISSVTVDFLTGNDSRYDWVMKDSDARCQHCSSKTLKLLTTHYKMISVIEKQQYLHDNLILYAYENKNFYQSKFPIFPKWQIWQKIILLSSSETLQNCYELQRNLKAQLLKRWRISRFGNLQQEPSTKLSYKENSQIPINSDDTDTKRAHPIQSTRKCHFLADILNWAHEMWRKSISCI